MRSTVINAKTIEEYINKALDKLQANRSKVNIEVIDEPRQGFLGLFGIEDAVTRMSSKDDAEEKGVGDFVENILNSDSNSVETEQKEDIKVVEDEKVVEEVEETRSTKDNGEIVETVEVGETVETEEAEDVKDSEESKRESEQEAESEEPDVIEESDVTTDRNDELFITSRNFLKQMIKNMGINCDIESRTGGNMTKFNILCSQEFDTGIIIGKRGETLDSLQYIMNLVTNRNVGTYIGVTLDCNQYKSKRERPLQKLARRLIDKAIQTGRNTRLGPMNPYERRIIHICLQNDENVNTSSQGNEPNRRVIIKRK